MQEGEGSEQDREREAQRPEMADEQQRNDHPPTGCTGGWLSLGAIGRRLVVHD